ncbi:hypothetical protein [Oribacterium sp. NK2B42]|uniref:hypothetical protein n=1 Tax=Oribacterium sp. NK2B42 TaxID=689781 RepID=UPI000400847E|nr:hypothetical protein [Oribacterium sp. NK2B42]
MIKTTDKKCLAAEGQKSMWISGNVARFREGDNPKLRHDAKNGNREMMRDM